MQFRNGKRADRAAVHMTGRARIRRLSSMSPVDVIKVARVTAVTPRQTGCNTLRHGEAIAAAGDIQTNGKKAI